MNWIKTYESFMEPGIDDLEDIFINILDMGFNLDAYITNFPDIIVPFFTYKDLGEPDRLFNNNESFRSLLISLEDIGSFVDSDLITELYLIIKRVEKVYNLEFKSIKVSQTHWLNKTEDNNLEDLLKMFQDLFLSPYRKKPLNNNINLFFKI